MKISKGWCAYRDRLDRVESANQLISTKITSATLWKDIDIDRSGGSDVSWELFKSVENVVQEAVSQGDPTLWHSAARCNHDWLLSQFLDDFLACQSLTVEDSQGNTALDVAIACGNTRAANVLKDYIARISRLAEKLAPLLAKVPVDIKIAAKTAFAKLSSAELLKACRRSEVHFEIAKQVLQEKLPTLKKLELANAQLTATDIITLVELVENPAQPLRLMLQHINLSQNAIGQEGLIALFPLLQRVGNTLQELNLSSCALTDKSLLGFIKNCFTELTKLFALDVTGNTFSEKNKALLQTTCDAKTIALEVGGGLAETPASHSESAPSMPWAGRQLFFKPLTPAEQAELHADLDRDAPSVWGGTQYTSGTTRYLDFRSEEPHVIAETFRSCVILECTKGTKIDVHNSLAEEKIIITFSKVPAEQSKNTALMKTLEQLKIPLILKTGTVTVLWSDLKSRHVNLCVSVFKAYHKGIVNAERAELSAEQMEKMLAGVKEDLLAEIQELREGQEEMARDTKLGLALQIPSLASP